jgi:hypothetical protein
MGHGAIDAIDTPTFGLQGEIAAATLLLNKIEQSNRAGRGPEASLRDRAARQPSLSFAGRVLHERRPELDQARHGRVNDSTNVGPMRY